MNEQEPLKTKMASRLQKFRQNNSMENVHKICIPKKTKMEKNVHHRRISVVHYGDVQEDTRLHAMKLRLRHLYSQEKEKKQKKNILITDITHTIGNNIIGFVFKKRPMMILRKEKEENKEEEEEEEFVVMEYEKQRNGIFSALNIKKKTTTVKKNISTLEKVSKKKRKTTTSRSNLKITNCCI